MDRKITVDDDDYEDIYDDPSLDALITNLCRSDDVEYKRKELSRKTRNLNS